MSNVSLSYWDIAIILFTLVIVVVIKTWASRKIESGEDLFLAGRSLGWLAIGFSLFASNISSTTLIGLSSQAYSNGISVSNYEWMATVVLVFFAIFFIPKYLRSRITTIPELLEKRFDSRSRKYFSALTILTNIIVDTAGSLFAGGLVIKLLFQIFFPDIAVDQDLILYGSIFCLAFVSGFTATGGLGAVAYTDIAQAVILLIGSGVITYMAFSGVNFSWDQIVSITSPDKLSLIRPIDDPTLPWLGTLVGVPILGFYFWCTNQFIVQRVLAAKNIRHARWGALFGGLLKLPVLFIMVLPGIIAGILYPNLANPDLVFPTMITKLLPVGLLGLVLAGLIAAIMSSIDSTLISASTLVTMDFLVPHYPNLKPEQIKRIGRWAIILFMVFAATWAPIINQFEGIFQYLQYALAYIVPPVVVIVIIGFFWKRGNGTGAFFALLGGHGVSILILVLEKMEMVQIHFTIMAGILFLVSSLIFMVVSLVTELPKKENIDLFSFEKKDIYPVDKNRVWYEDYRVHSFILIGLTLLIVVLFW